MQAAQRQTVAGRDEVQRAAHEQRPHGSARLQQAGELFRREPAQPGPDADVGFLRLLGLQPDEVLDEVEHRAVGPGEQVLAGEQSPVERPDPEHRPVVHRAT